MSKVSIHLITFNGEKYIPHCLRSLEDQTYKDFSLLIIDNNSQDQTTAIIGEYLQPQKHPFLKRVTKVVRNAKNLGFAGAHNQAIHWTKSDYVLLLNQDIILDSAYVEKLADFFDTNKNAACATGILYQWNFGQLTAHSPVLGKTTRIDSLGLKLFKNHRVVELKDTALLSQSKGKEKIEIFGVSGALPMYKREALEQSKIPTFITKGIAYEYFDSDFFAYKEDVDLAYRLALFGHKSYILPNAFAWHDRTAAQNAPMIKNRKLKSSFINYHSYKNHLYFLQKNVPSALWMRIGYKILFYELAKFFFILFSEPKTIPVLKEVVKNIVKMNKKRRYVQKKAGNDAWKNIRPWI